MKGELQLAVVTPYYREPDDVLRKCLASVAAQTYSARRHFLIADGHPNPLVADWDVRHIPLPNAHADNGNLARTIGAMAAISEGFDGIAFLDADNWLREDHLAGLATLHGDTGAAVCTSGRSIHRLDGAPMYVDRAESDGRRFADTSCLCIFRPAFDLISLWATMPPALGPICDQVMWDAILERGVSRAHTGEPTVAFRTRYAFHYRNAGETPPAGAKEPAEMRPAILRYRGMPPADRAALLRGLGGDGEAVLTADYRKAAARTNSVTVQAGERRMQLETPHEDGIRHVLEEIFARHCYRPVEGLPEPRTVLDIGANVGLSAAYFRLVYPTAALYCVEPEAAAYRLLVGNAKAIGNCEAYRAGLHNATHSVGVRLGPSSVENSRAPIGACGARTLLLDARQFVSGLPVQSFELVKIDTEGAEVPIMLSLRRELDAVPLIHLRFHSESDRRVIDELLTATHVLWRGMVESPNRGTLTYVSRSRAIPPIRHPLS